MRTRGCGRKPIGEILRFVGHQSFAEFHDAHRVRWCAVIAKYEFSDPEIAAADNSPDRKTLLVRLDESALLNVVPTADPLARLRIFKYSILAVDFMFDLEIARVRSIPVALQRRPHCSIIHLNLPPSLPANNSGSEFMVLYAILNLGPPLQWAIHTPRAAASRCGRLRFLLRIPLSGAHDNVRISSPSA